MVDGRTTLTIGATVVIGEHSALCSGRVMSLPQGRYPWRRRWENCQLDETRKAKTMGSERRNRRC